jgi:8-oxo-dGTP diphosphatase
VLRLRFTTMVEAPLTVAFDVARSFGRPWVVPLAEVRSVRPVEDLYALPRGSGFRRLTHGRTFTATGSGTLVEELVEGEAALLGRLVPPFLLRRRVLRAMRAHLDSYAAVAARRAQSVVQVVGAAVVRDGRVLVAQRSGGAFDGCWEFPGGKVEPGEPDLAALVRELREELGVDVVPEVFLGEVVLDGPVGGGEPGASTMRVWSCRLTGGEPVAHEHAALRWARADELDALDWIEADRPLLPAVRTLLHEV